MSSLSSEAAKPADLQPQLAPMAEGDRQFGLIAVIRIPKSASVSLATIILQAFPNARRYPLPNTLNPDAQISRFQRLRHARHVLRINLRAHRTARTSIVFDRINAEKRPIGLLTGGHIDFETCRRNIVHRLRFVTLVRNPIDRSLSEYRYLRAGFEKKPSFARFDASLTAKAAGRYSFDGYLDFLIEHGDVFADIACRHVGLPQGADIARHFANNAFCFGTVDKLREFTLNLAERVGRPVQVQHLNQSTAHTKHQLTLAERRKIERLYSNDIALYEWCSENAAASAAQGKEIVP